MSTSLASDVKQEELAELRSIPVRTPMLTRAELLWTAVGFALLGAFLALVVEDYPLRTLISAN